MYWSVDLNYYDRLDGIKKSLDIAVKIDFTNVKKLYKAQNAYAVVSVRALRQCKYCSHRQGWIQTSATSFRKLVRNLKERKKYLQLFFLLLNLILVIVFCHRFSFFLLRAPIVPAFNLFP